jgi:hypothetical protein
LLHDALDRAERRSARARHAARDAELATPRGGSLPPLRRAQAGAELDSAAASAFDESADRPVPAHGPKPELGGASGLARLAQRFRDPGQPPERPQAELRVLTAPAKQGIERRQPGELSVHAEPLQPVSGGGAASLWEFETQLAAVLRRQLRQAGLLPPEREP